MTRLLVLFLFLALLPTSHASAAAAPAGGYTALVKSFDTLCKDSKKGAVRENWLNLEDKFEKLASKSKGDARIRAMYHTARCREELARRSAAGGDAAEAAKLFGRVAAASPKHSLAPESKYRQAALLAGPRLNQTKEAAAALAELQKRWPKSQAAKKGADLAGRLERSGSTAKTGASRRSTNERAGSSRRASSGEEATASKPSGSSSRQRSETGRKPRTGGASRDVMEQLGLGINTIIIDPGHGGKDPGTTHRKLIEKKLALAMAKSVGAMLEKKGIRVIYTRVGDTYPSLEARTRMANASTADLFLSFHYNANPSSSVSGLEIYYLSKARSADAAAVAARENGISTQKVSDLQFIVTDLMLGSKLDESRALAQSLQRGIINRVARAGYKFNDNGVRPAPFYVLVGARMPAVLVEFGYLTNPGDATKISQAAFCKAQAEGLVNGILSYRENLAKMGAGIR